MTPAFTQQDTSVCLKMADEINTLRNSRDGNSDLLASDPAARLRRPGQFTVRFQQQLDRILQVPPCIVDCVPFGNRPWQFLDVRDIPSPFGFWHFLVYSCERRVHLLSILSPTSKSKLPTSLSSLPQSAAVQRQIGFQLRQHLRFRKSVPQNPYSRQSPRARLSYQQYAGWPH